MMEFGGIASGAGERMLARTYGPDSDALTTFRSRADVDYDRSLSTLIESEIIPRLIVVHAADGPIISASATGRRNGEDSRQTIDPAEVAELASLSLRVEADALLSCIEEILARGVSVETMMVDLMAPTARLLGEYWDDDRCDFIDVTMGLWRLQEVVHELACRIPADRLAAAGGHRVLFASMAGDQHQLGAVLIDELFRRAGWVTDRISNSETSELLKRASNDWFDMIGLTISCDCHIANLAAVIVALRNVSMNSRVCVMVGGAAFSANPAVAAQVGADGTARDAKLALKVAEGLVRDREREVAALAVMD